MLVGPTIRRRRLGVALRQLREARQLKLEDVAVSLGVAASTLSRIETGKTPTRTSYIVMMLDLYRVEDPDQRRLLTELAREGQRKGWWADYDELLPPGTGTYLGLEAEAAVIRSFQAQVVHGLLQTEEYARAVLTATRPGLTEEAADRIAAVQMRRQEVILGSDPARLELVLDESALHRTPGGSGLLRRQLEHLAAVSGTESVRIRVLPLAGSGRIGLGPSFSVLSFGHQEDPDVLCVEGLRGHMLIEERDTEVLAMRATLDALGQAALPPDESARLIGQAVAAMAGSLP